MDHHVSAEKTVTGVIRLDHRAPAQALPYGEAAAGGWTIELPGVAPDLPIPAVVFSNSTGLGDRL